MFAFTALLTDTATRSVRSSSKLEIYLRGFVIISQYFLIKHHRSFGHATIAQHNIKDFFSKCDQNIKHVLWHVIAAHVAFYSQPGLNPPPLPSIFKCVRFATSQARNLIFMNGTGANLTEKNLF